MDKKLFKTANRKQQNTDNVSLLAKNCDIMLEILNKFDPQALIRDPENCDIKPIFLSMFFICPCNYYNDNDHRFIDDV